MPLDRGVHLGPYRILEPIGAGGMGEVYLAEDSRLGRRVALKILPTELANDPVRLGRFEQEARTAAALNHPHIASVFDVGMETLSGEGVGGEASSRMHFIVQEFLEGESLRQRLARGSLPLMKVLDLATEIAEALAAAHTAGIVHRDLKPDNVFVTTEGHAKVLDFGLAKLMEAANASPSPGGHGSESPTMLRTAAGQVLGTPGYMAPEQILGEERIDHRADVFAFGCLLFEMLSGEQLFTGMDRVDTQHRVLHEATPQLPEREQTYPPQLQWILDKCLAREPDERYQHTRDLAVRLKHLRRQVDSGAVAPTQHRREWKSASTGRGWLAGLAVLAVGLLAGFLARDFFGFEAAPSATASVSARFSVLVPDDGRVALGGQPPGAIAISRDGSKIAFAANRGGRAMLYLRPMNDLEFGPLPGTENAQGPFFSPTGDWLGFYADGKFKSVSLSGGAPVVLASAAAHRGATVTRDGEVIYVPSVNSGLWIVRADGGTARQLTQLEAGGDEYSHRWPYAMPDGKTVLFTIDRGGSFDEADIGLLSLDSGARRILVSGGSYPVYSPTGHLLFSRQGTLLAVAFDERRGEVIGRPTVVLTGVATQQDTGAAHFALSHNGVLTYVPGGAQTNERTLTLVSDDGSMRPIAGLPQRAYQQPSLSPGGKRLAVNIVEATHDLWISEIDRGTLTRLTFHGDNHSPVWSPDGRRVAFSSERVGPSQLYWIEADGSGEEEELFRGEHSMVPTSFSPTSLLAYTEVHPETRGDVWILAVEQGRETQPFLVTEYDEKEAVFSPDGSFLAYVSNESGRYEVFVQPFPGPGRKLQISSDGGGQPVWSRDGRRVFYRSGDRMMEVPIATAPLRAESPRLLFEGRFEAGYVYNTRIFDVAADGSGFIMAKGEPRAEQSRLDVVLGWSEDLRRRVEDL